MREKGTVKFFHDVNGYGFIIDKDGKDVFVHYSSVEVDGYKTLRKGQVVEFTRIAGKSAGEFAAQEVKPISE